MWEYIVNLFNSEFMPHGQCYLWKPEIVWVHVLSDSGIVLAYLLIPIALTIFVRKRDDLIFNWIFILFAMFIFACGMTHLMEIWSVWHGTYRLTGAIKFGASIISLATAFVLWRLLPKALMIPSVAQMERLNRNLQRQIAEREQTEKKFWQFLEWAPDAMVIVNAAGNMIYVNAQTEALFGYERDELLEYPVEILMPERYRQGHPANCLHFFAAPNFRAMGGGLELYGQRKDGGEFPVEISLGPIESAEGLLVAASIRDVTGRREAEAALQAREKQLQQYTAELERSNADMDAFVYIASHDLKEPLRGIHNYAQILLEDCAEKLDEENQNDLATLGRLAQRMEGLIDDLRLYSRIGRAERGQVDLDMQQVVHDACEQLQVLLDEKGVEVRVPRCLPHVMYQPSHLMTIVQNLIANAARYNDKPNKWIEIGAQRGESTPVFYVRDNGIGIDPDLHDQVFLMFRRLHVREKYGSGSGVGLAMVKRILECHGGCIWLESQPGEGTTFYFTLATGDRKNGRHAHTPDFTH